MACKFTISFAVLEFIIRDMTNGSHTPRIAVFPGTFDPITRGHLDVIERGRKLFDQLVVAVGHNPEKRHLFTQAERAEMIRELVAGMSNVKVDVFTGLTVDYARKIGAAGILRGIRNSSDLQFEFQVALTNRVVAGVETLFIMTSEQFAFTSSSLIKQVASMGGDVSALVPPNVVERMRLKRLIEHPGDAHLEETP
jgi:pantetheine-phosphate adenylyltransferase